MHGRERRRDRDTHGQRDRQRERAFRGELAIERPTRDVLHGEPDDAALFVDRQRVEPDDVRVLDLTERPRFLDDLRTQRRPACLQREQLHGRRAELGCAVGLPREPDGREAAASELLDQQERPKTPFRGGVFEEGAYRIHGLAPRGVPDRW